MKNVRSIVLLPFLCAALISAATAESRNMTGAWRISAISESAGARSRDCVRLGLMNDRQNNQRTEKIGHYYQVYGKIENNHCRVPDGSSPGGEASIVDELTINHSEVEFVSETRNITAQYRIKWTSPDSFKLIGKSEILYYKRMLSQK